MTTQELQKKYLSIYHSFKNVGFKNKIILLLMIIPAIFYSYLILDGKYYRYHWDRFMPHSQIVIITIGAGLAMILIIITIKSFSFINSRKAKSFRFYFKTELFDYVKSEIPEICDYVYNQKIHPKVFYNSNLFKTKYSDYIGDDWIRGRVNNVLFEMCELHVFNLFKNIFSGIFIKIRKNEDSISIADNIAWTKEYISNFEVKYNAKVLTSQNQNGIFIAIEMKGKFFEADNPKMIILSNENVILLNDIVDLIKKITGSNKGSSFTTLKK